MCNCGQYPCPHSKEQTLKRAEKEALRRCDEGEFDMEEREAFIVGVYWAL